MAGDDARKRICRGPHERAGDDAEDDAATDLSRPATTRRKNLGSGGETANRSVGGEATEFRRPRRRITTGPVLTRMMRI